MMGTLGQAPTLPANIPQGLMRPSVTNTLDYCGMDLITGTKKFCSGWPRRVKSFGNGFIESFKCIVYLKLDQRNEN